MRLEGLRQLKNFSNLNGNRTRDLPSCGIVPQPTTLRRAVLYIYVRGLNVGLVFLMLAEIAFEINSLVSSNIYGAIDGILRI
jgi:hypothetical protein